MKIEENKEYYGNMISEWNNEHKGKYVIAGFNGGDTDRRIGRVAQVRIEAGCFGSDTVLLRHCDDVLTPHENNHYYEIPQKFYEELDVFFKDAYLDDSDKHEYTLSGEFGEIGFIIKSPIKEGESTPMRDIKTSISNRIAEL